MEELLFKSEFYEEINYLRFSAGILLLIVLTKIIEYIYWKFSDSPTNKKLFASIFTLFSISIFLIVSTIKSSLALSLGMVGALSIIRFRTAIKDPEQLVYFLGITGIAIAIAAEKEIIAVLVTFLFSIFAILKTKGNDQLSEVNYLLITMKSTKSFQNISVIDKLTKLDQGHNLKCKNFYEDSDGNLRITFFIKNITNIDLTSIKQSLKALEIDEFTLRMLDQ